MGLEAPGARAPCTDHESRCRRLRDVPRTLAPRRAAPRGRPPGRGDLRLLLRPRRPERRERQQPARDLDVLARGHGADAILQPRRRREPRPPRPRAAAPLTPPRPPPPPPRHP